MPKWRNWQTRYVQGVVGESPWEFESPLRHHISPGSGVRAQLEQPGRVQEGSTLPEHVVPENLDAMVLAHLRGYPDDLRRFSNLTKQAHLDGRAAVEFFLSRPTDAHSFLATLCRLVRDGEDVVTVVEAAEILGVPPAALLDPDHAGVLPVALAGEGRYRIWRRADIAAARTRRDARGA